MTFFCEISMLIACRGLRYHTTVMEPVVDDDELLLVDDDELLLFIVAAIDVMDDFTWSPVNVLVTGAPVVDTL